MTTKTNRGTRAAIYLRDLIRVLVSRDFKLRYKRSVLGILWSLLVPVAQLAVLDVVFKSMIPLNIPHFTTFLFVGILPWGWFQASLLTSSLSIVDNRELVKQVGFPVGVLPAVSVISNFLHFLLALPVLVVFLLADGFHLGRSLTALPAVMLVQFLFICSLCYIVATLQVRFRDTQYLVGIFLFLFFYLTPVFWDISTIPEPFKDYMLLNPMGLLLTAYRSIIIGGDWPALTPLLAVTAVSVLVLGMGYLMLLWTRDRFVEEL